MIDLDALRAWNARNALARITYFREQDRRAHRARTTQPTESKDNTR